MAEARTMVEAAARQLALDLGIDVPAGEEARAMVDRIDGFRPTDGDLDDFKRHHIQLTGQFLVDRDGIVRWCSREETAS